MEINGRDASWLLVGAGNEKLNRCWRGNGKKMQKQEVFLEVQMKCLDNFRMKSSGTIGEGQNLSLSIPKP